MHDSYLLNKISKGLRQICSENKIKEINYFVLVVSHSSDINGEILREHLMLNDSNLVGDKLSIRIQREDIEDQTAIIYSIQGEKIAT